MIKKMVRVALWGLMSKQREIVSFLHEEGLIHLEYSDSARISAKDADSLRLLRAKLMGMIELLEWNGWDQIKDDDLKVVDNKLKLPFPDVISEIDGSLDHFKTQLSGLFDKRDDLNRLRDKLKKSKDVLFKFRSFIEEHSRENRNVSLWWVKSDTVGEVIGRLQVALKGMWTGAGRIPDIRHHFSLVGEREGLLSLAVPVELGDVLSECMSKEGLLWTPPVSSKNDSLLKSVENMDKAISELPSQQREFEDTLNRVRSEWGSKLGCLFILIDERLEQLVAEQGSHNMGSTFLLEGWLPENDRDEFCKRIKSIFGDEVLIRWRYPASDEWFKVPTALDNSSIFKPFEIFLKLVPTPNYRGTDPTVMIGIFFPFFAGCIVGDGGYGIILALLSWFIRSRAKKKIVSDLSFVLLSVSIWSILWGVAYGEFFGDFAYRVFGLHPLWVERSHAVIPVLSFTIALGLGHILIGLGLGVIDGIKNKNRHVWMEKAGNGIIILSIVALLCSIKGVIPQAFFSFSIGVLIIGLALLIVGGGIGGAVEAMSSFGSILSYVRIGAIGLSSAILAMVASKFVDVLGVSFLGIFIALAIHLLNFVLATAESGLHSARLHYVEFMGKFYTGGGNQYKPFSKKRRNY
nr:V-type ATPase 116kDa subunit family protein [uncultured Dethiosulfovibrio sp.]